MLEGYREVRELYRGRKRAVYRGIRDDGVSVIIKTLPPEHFSSADLAGLRREYEILKDLNIDGAARALALEKQDKNLALILHDLGGETLRALIDSQAPVESAPFSGKNGKTRLDLAAFLRLAIRLADTLAGLHGAGIVHKDINPKNLIINLESGRFELIDFSISSRLPQETQRLSHPNLLEGTLAYISPEQTGRMNRTIDYRTDLYSLGVTLFEMLTGTLPFTASDPMELIHSHMAREPQAPHEINPDVPRALSAIVLKLLSKTAENRYASALGLKADLEFCLDQLETTGAIPPFPAGLREVPDRFNLPQKLYGREKEIESLLSAFERLAQGATELMLVYGYSGIGKTSLIHEVHKPIVRQRGYFISGKFDQMNRVVPYSALIQAFQELVQQLLTESSEEVQEWKSRLLAALGPNGPVLMDVIPEIELILGKQPPVPQLAPAETQNRFNLVFQSFIEVFAAPEHPLVIFLDDLQWADSATLKLLQTLLTSSDIRSLLLIGAYRDNEVGPSHPLLLTVGEIEKAGTTLHRISLAPLEEQHVNELISDTLRCARDRSAPLAGLVMRKTLGNPFFVLQFLKTLYADMLVEFNRTTGQWQYDLPRIELSDMTDNVVELMAGRIQKLSQETQHALKLAACIGNRFDLHTLSIVNEKPASATALELSAALLEGLVIPSETGFEALSADALDGAGAQWVSFRFMHDRVQQAAYALIPEATRKGLHLRIGELMLSGSTDAEREEKLFDIVNQLNVGAELIASPEKRGVAARLNLAAGRKAKTSTAYRTALTYFRSGISLLGEDCWSNNYEFSFAIHCELAECEYLCGDFEKAEQDFDLLLGKARTELEKASVLNLRVLQYENTARYADAVEAARSGLRLFGIELPIEEAEKQRAFESEMEAIAGAIRDRAIASLVDLPVMTDPRMKMCMRLLMTAWAPAYIAGDRVTYVLIAARMVRLSLEHGNSEESAYAYVIHAVTMGAGMGDYVSGYEFGRLALEVNEKFQDRKLRAKVHHMFSCFVNLWRMPVSTCFPHSREAYRVGLETGDFAYATYGIFHESWYGLLTGPDIAAFVRDYTPALHFLLQIKNFSFAGAQQIILHWAGCLQGLNESKLSLSDHSFREGEYAATYRDNAFFETFYYIAKLHILYTFEENEAALEAACKAETVVHALAGTLWQALLCHYHALTLTALGIDNSKLESLVAQMKIWAEHSPENFRHRYLQMSAEQSRLRGDDAAAMKCYEEAILLGHKHELPQQEALGSELYGKFWIRRGNRKIGDLYLADALFGWQQWGAAAKARDLEERYPQLRQRRDGGAAWLPAGGSLQTTTARPGAMDLFTVTKAAQAISGEVALEPLLQTLTRMVMENAGAQRGILLWEKESLGALQAEGTADDPVIHISRIWMRNYAPSIVNFVKRTGQSLVLADAESDSRFGGDPYIQENKPRSVLCIPILHQRQVIGILYLENNLTTEAFTPDRIQVVQILASQAAISLENAALYEEMKQEISQRKKAEEALREALTEVEQLKNRLQAENIYLQEEIKTQHNFEEIVGDSAAIRKVFQSIERVAGTDATVWISGETGTGKELVARAIHNLSPRKDSPLIKVNCAALPAGLIESELFGHEKGAFTGAIARKKGRFELADRGTLFLDEVGELPLDTQVKLLRVLQEQEFERVGGAQTLKVDVRVIAATNRDLQDAVRQGSFRADLYYRLNIFPIFIPPLRERAHDIPILTNYFVGKFSRRTAKKIDQVAAEAMDELCHYSWPGNVRELANVLERAVILCDGGVLRYEHLGLAAPSSRTAEQVPTIQQAERDHILKALEKTDWVVGGDAGAAKMLGLNRTTLLARMKKLGIQRP